MFTVQRLNAVLSQYQNKCQPPGPQDEQVTGDTYSIVEKSHFDTPLSEHMQAVPLSSQGPHASWLTDRRYKPRY